MKGNRQKKTGHEECAEERGLHGRRDTTRIKSREQGEEHRDAGVAKKAARVLPAEAATVGVIEVTDRQEPKTGRGHDEDAREAETVRHAPTVGAGDASWVAASDATADCPTRA